MNNALIRPQGEHPKGPLESYPLSQLHLVGTLSKGSEVWGLISTPDGTIYHISNGEYIGQTSAKVVGITPQKLTVQETISDGLGGWNTHIKELPITTPSQQDTAP
ncbi:MAG: pilus assembly protein PilP [Gammaproteobacteria bacterium]|nr:pilus assembly protein PilP [Gammaproteobacteria bacterium]